MEKRSLGRTGLKVSVVGFGGIPIIARSRAEAEKVVRYAYERGITYFDTARYYGDSEEKIGAALKDVRDDVVLATKTIQRTREGAAKDLKQSFRNLQTDRVDIVQLHMIESEEELARVTISDGVLNALKEARSQGKIDYIGITGHNPYILAKAIMTGEFDTVQVPLNVLERRALEGLIPVARKLNVGVVIMKPLGGCGTPPLQYPQRGVWFLGRPELDWPDTSEFITYFGRDGLERAQRCLRFILAHDVDTIIPGLRSIEEVDWAVQVADSFDGLTLDEKEAYKFGKLPPEPFCRECGLCMPCPEGIDIPTILRWDTYYTFYGIERWTRDQYPKLRAKVDDCTECGECEKKCPYHIPVIRMLKEAEERLG